MTGLLIFCLKTAEILPPAPQPNPDGCIGFHVKAALEQCASQDEVIETLGMAIYMGSNHGDVSSTDGYVNMTFLQRRPELHESRTECGLHHIGIEVDNMAETLGALSRIASEHADRRRTGRVAFWRCPHL